MMLVLTMGELPHASHEDTPRSGDDVSIYTTPLAMTARALATAASKKNFTRWSRKWFRAQAVLAVAAVGVALMTPEEKSGDVSVTAPAIVVAQNPSSAVKVLEGNVHHQDAPIYTPILKRQIQKRDPQIISLQEVTSDQASSLAYYMPDWWITKVTTDGLQRGGFANVVMTREKPRDIKTLSLDGSSVVATLWNGSKGLIEDVADAAQSRPTSETAFQHTKEGWEENRAAVAITSDLTMSDGEKVPIRFITAHITGQSDNYPDMHDKQLNALGKFAQENTNEDRLTIVCGDFNTQPKQAIYTMYKYGFITDLDRDEYNEPKYTSLPDPGAATGKTIDYCFHSLNKDFEPGATKVLDGIPAIEGEDNMRNRWLDHRFLYFSSDWDPED